MLERLYRLKLNLNPCSLKTQTKERKVNAVVILKAFILCSHQKVLVHLLGTNYYQRRLCESVLAVFPHLWWLVQTAPQECLQKKAHIPPRTHTGWFPWPTNPLASRNPDAKSPLERCTPEYHIPGRWRQGGGRIGKERREERESKLCRFYNPKKEVIQLYLRYSDLSTCAGAATIVRSFNHQIYFVSLTSDGCVWLSRSDFHHNTIQKSDSDATMNKNTQTDRNHNVHSLTPQKSIMPLKISNDEWEVGTESLWTMFLKKTFE